MVFLLNQNKTEKNRKQKERKGEYLSHLPGLALLQPSWPAHLAAQPTRGSPVFYLLPVGRGEAGHDARRGHVSRHLLLLPLIAWITRATPRTPRTSLTLSRSPSSSGSLSLPSPSAPESAAARRRGHRPPLALPLRPEAPPHRRLPPRQATRLGRPWRAASPPSSSPVAGDRLRRPAVFSASPSSPTSPSSPP